LKRKDCWEHPEHEQPDLRSTLFMLPHQSGERWIVGERVFHVMGTCQMYNSAFLDKIGYLYQPS
jgi:predicted RecA/RadA family phage recombinase